MTVTLTTATARETERVGKRLATVVRAGDLLLLSGDLGAGKTTLVRGLGAGLGVRGPVTSPTFVISRLHPSRSAGPALLHVDAYRLGGLAELDDLDLDAVVDTAVTAVEWGIGRAEALSGDRLEVVLHRTPGGGESAAADGARRIEILGVGPRWQGVDLEGLLVGDAD